MTQRVDKNEAEWQQELSPEQFAVCRKGGTERAFTGKYWDHKGEGAYKCSCCGAELFSGKTKFDSGSGWPSFYQPAQSGVIAEHTDNTHGMTRTEVKCGVCDAHLGHVFPDGPAPTGLRYCINSVSLDYEEGNAESPGK